jgi:tetratricopeptide (TPR) repeat protein
VSTQRTTRQTEKLVDENGHFLGFQITEEKNINLAAPASSFRDLVRDYKPTLVSDLKHVGFSGSALSLYMKGITARDRKQVDEAMGYFKQAIKLNPRLSGARLELGLLYYRMHDFDKEAFEYNEILKIDPDNVDALYNLAWNLESHGKYREATPMYEKALRLAPDDTEILYQLGLSYLAQGNRGKAIDMYGRLRNFDSGNAELLRRLIK